jgi:myo-inositol 2-dehydrogenase / D-chiro-inositol 1-dehydrogenase
VVARLRTRADIRIGIVGCGRAASSLHVPALRGVAGAAIVALSDSDPGRLRQLASQCDGAAGVPDYLNLLEDERVDLVAVCVPATVHAAVAVAALRARKHVFVEKPLALTLEECDRLVDEARLAESHGARSAVGFNLRSHRLVGQARNIVQSGQLGGIELVRSTWTADWSDGSRPPWHAVRAQGGGALLEIGSHVVDLWRYLLASEVESIHALSSSRAFDDQSAVFEARMRSGVLVSAAVSQRSASHNTIEVFGQGGSLRFSCYHADSLEVSMTGGRTTGAWRRIRPLLEKAAKLPAAVRAARQGGDFLASYARQWERILDAIRHGRPVPASIEDGREAARIVIAALHSCREGGAVAVNGLSLSPPEVGR